MTTEVRSHAGGLILKRKRRCVFDKTVMVALYRQRGRYNHKTGHTWEKVALFCEKCHNIDWIAEISQ